MSGRRDFLKLLGLGGASAAAGLVGCKALGGKVEAAEGGTLWTTHQFPPDAKITGFDNCVAEMWAKDSLKILEERAKETLDRSVDEAVLNRVKEYTGRTVTMRVLDDYDRGHAKRMAFFGRVPKIGEVIEFQGRDDRYTVIEVTNDGLHSDVLLDRPLEASVADDTSVSVVFYPFHRELDKDEIRLTRDDLQSIIQISDGSLTFSETYEHQFSMERGSLDRLYAGPRKMEGTLSMRMDSFKGADPVELMKGGPFTIETPTSDGTTVLSGCLWTDLTHDMLSADISIDFIVGAMHA